MRAGHSRGSVGGAGGSFRSIDAGEVAGRDHFPPRVSCDGMVFLCVHLVLVVAAEGILHALSGKPEFARWHAVLPLEGRARYRFPKNLRYLS